MNRSRSVAARGEEAIDRLTRTHEQLTAAIEALTHDGQWQRMLATAAKFPHYSAANVLLIMAQHPDATKVAGLRTWNCLGRHVIKGEKSIAILAPCTYPVKNKTTQNSRPGSADNQPPASVTDIDVGDPTAAASSTEQPRQLRGFRVVSVFDVSQTDGPPLPDSPTPVHLSGAAPAGMWDGLATVAAADGYTLERADCSPADGWTNYTTRTIRIVASHDDAHATLTLAHELGHVRAEHHTRFAGRYATSRDCRGLAEVEAESIAYLTATIAGLRADAASVPYVTAWANGDLALIRATAARVVTTARSILQAADLLPAPLRDRAPTTAAEHTSSARWATTRRAGAEFADTRALRVSGPSR